MNKKIQVVFYKTPAGNEPVREWLLSLDLEDKKLLVLILKQLNMAGQLVCQFQGLLVMDSMKLEVIYQVKE